jgi:hypothetical protein
MIGLGTPGYSPGLTDRRGERSSSHPRARRTNVFDMDPDDVAANNKSQVLLHGLLVEPAGRQNQLLRQRRPDPLASVSDARLDLKKDSSSASSAHRLVVAARSNEPVRGLGLVVGRSTWTWRPTNESVHLPYRRPWRRKGGAYIVAMTPLPFGNFDISTSNSCIVGEAAHSRVQSRCA